MSEHRSVWKGSCLALLFVTALLGGCLPRGSGIRPSCPSPPAFLAALMERQNPGKTLSVLADLDLQALGRRYPIQAALLTKFPDCLRLETLPPIGPPDAMLALRGDRLQVYLPREATFYSGSASRHLLRFMPIPLPTEDLPTLLLGFIPPLRQGDCLVPEELPGNQRRISVVAGDGRPRMTLVFSSSAPILVGLEKEGAEGQPGYTAVFSDHTLVDGVPVPTAIVLRWRGSSGMTQTATLRYTEMSWLTDPPPGDAFELAVPPGVVRQEMGDEN